MNKKVVVTGAAGFIGSHQVEYLIGKGYNVVGIDNFHPYYSKEIKRDNLNSVQTKAANSKGNFKFVNGSILNNQDLEKLPENPKWVFHLAALAGTRSSLKKSSAYSRTNVYGTSRLVEYFEDIEKFIYVSSSSVYGDVSKRELPVSEERNCEPKTPYSLSKHNAEKVVMLNSKIQDLEYSIVRPFTVFGPRQRPDEVFTKFISKIIEGEKIKVYGSGTQSRDFTYVGDVVEGIFLAAEKGQGIYNLGNGRRLTVNELITLLDKKIDKPVKKEHIASHPADVGHTCADITKARTELGYNPQKKIDEGIDQCIKWIKQIMDSNTISEFIINEY